jgi:putative ABC transport system permease protein
VAPILGRGLQAGDAAATGEPVVALSETFWRQRFGGDRAIVGRTVRIDGEPHTVVGVVPASVESFAEQMRSIAHELATLYPEDAYWSVGVGPLGGSALGGARSLLALSVGAALLVLLIACANVANLSLAQGTRRRHEFAIRAAIGASPWRIARQLLCESSLVVVLGAVFGLLIARGGLGVIARFYAADSLAPAALPIDARSLAFTIGLTFATTALVGLFPAIEAARGATRAQIAESGFGATTARARDGLRRGLVVGQVAASLVLLVGAALLSRSFLNLLAVDGGVATEGVTSIRAERLEQPSGPAEVAGYIDRMLEALSAVPGIPSADSCGSTPTRSAAGSPSSASRATC